MIDTDEFRYQIVIQLPIESSGLEAFDEIVALEDDALERLSQSLALVDGHDVGWGKQIFSFSRTNRRR